MTRVSWWLSGRDGTNTKQRHGDKIRRDLQWKDGGEETRNSWQSMGPMEKRVMGCSGRLFGKLRPSHGGY